MNKVTLSQINSFLANEIIAVAGASRNEKSFGYKVVAHLKNLNYKVFSINSAYDSSVPYQDKYTSLAEISGNNFGLLIVTPKEQTLQVLQQAIAKGVKHIWIQQMSETPEIMNYSIPYESNIVF
jgi:predicted CoA-binding protein